MPFVQLKSLEKILIGVPYDKTPGTGFSQEASRSSASARPLSFLIS